MSRTDPLPPLASEALEKRRAGVRASIPPPPPEAAQLAIYRASMRELFARARALDITQFETASPDALRSDLHPRTKGLLDDTSHLLGALIEGCEAERITSDRPSELLDLGAGDAVGSGFESGVADVAFIAQVELRQRAARLDGLRGQEAALIAECDGALRRVTKALAALDQALARAANASPCLEIVGDLDLSLSVRRCYAAFRASVRGLDEPSPPSPERLRAAGCAIAVLVGHPIYPQLRLADRYQLRALQQRLVQCLRAGATDAVEGARLWSDIVAFASMLTQVNRRQELFEHDRQIVRRVLASVASLAAVSDAMAGELARLGGRDDEVDKLLREERRDLSAWAPILTRLAHELGDAHEDVR